LGSRKSRKRKRAVTATQSLLTVSPTRAQRSTGNSVLLQLKQKQTADDTPQKEARKQKKLRVERERAANQDDVQVQQISLQGGNSPPSKRSKNNRSTTQKSQTDHVSISSPLLTSLEAKNTFPSASTLDVSQHQPQPCHTHVIHPPMPQYSRHHIPSFTPQPVPPTSLKNLSLMLTNMQTPAQHDLQFDPFLPWLYMLPGAFPTPIPMAPMCITPMSLSVPSTDQPAVHPNPGSCKTLSKPKLKAPKINLKPQTSQLLPNQPVLEKPFTIRVFPRGTEAWAQSVSYLPIGKPDLHFKHGIFPIIPSIMLSSDFSKSASSSTMCQNSFKPDILSTLVLENIPQASCNVSWVKKWCLSASDIQPRHILVAARRALIEFQNPDDAVKAWASRKSEVSNLLSLLVYWYRPDLEQERSLLDLWRRSKKSLLEVISTAVVKDRNIVLRAIEEALEAVSAKLKSQERGDADKDEDTIIFNGVDVNNVKQNWSAPDVKGEFRNLAGRLAFWEKYDMARKGGMTGGQLLIWEQQETARVDRVRSIAYARQKGGNVPQTRKRMLDEKVEGELEGDVLRRKRARKVAGEDIIEQLPASAVVVSASTIQARLDPCIRTATLSTRRDALEIKPAVPVISRNTAGPIVGVSLLSSPPAKSEELSRNTHITSSMSSRVHGGPIRVQSLPSASMTSSMVSGLRDVGLSRIMPSPAPSANIASLPISPLSSTALPTRKDGKQRFQEDFITESIPAQVSPAPRFSSILTAIEQEQEEDMVKTGTSESSSGSDVKFATMAGKDLRIGQASESTDIMENLRVVQESTPCDKRSQNRSSSVLGALNASFEEPTSTIYTNLKPHTEPNLTLLQSSEPVIPEVNPLQRLNDKSDLSDKISPVSEQMANIILSTSVMEAVMLPKIATTQESQLQQAPVRTAPVTSLIPLKSPIQVQTMSSDVLAELTRMLTKSKEERQAFLDREFDATKNLIDKLVATTCKEQRKRITSLWKEKIRYAPFLIRLTLFGC